MDSEGGGSVRGREERGGGRGGGWTKVERRGRAMGEEQGRGGGNGERGRGAVKGSSKFTRSWAAHVVVSLALVRTGTIRISGAPLVVGTKFQWGAEHALKGER